MKNINPDNIVESAGLWDMPEFASWFSEMTNKSFAQVKNGAIAIDPSALEKIMLD